MDKKRKMFSLVEKWRESNLTRNVFAEQNGISPTSFDYWCKKQSNEVLKKVDQPTFIELNFQGRRTRANQPPSNRACKEW